MSGTIRFGEAFAGEVPNNAHPNVVVGPAAVLGPIIAQALATPSPGFVPFLAVLAPNVMLRPVTLFVPKVPIVTGTEHARLTWGAAQAGLALGVHEMALSADDLAVIAAVWVNPDATDEAAIGENNRIAIREAIGRALAGEPGPSALDAAARMPFNPFHSGR